MPSSLRIEIACASRRGGRGLLLALAMSGGAALGAQRETLFEGGGFPVHDIYGPAPESQVADIDGDGLDDLVQLVGATSIDVRRGVLDGSFGPAEHHAVPSAHSLLVGDVDGDGLPDLLFVTQPDAVGVLRSVGQGAFSAPALTPLAGYASLLDVPPRDVNHDGHADALLGLGGVVALLGHGDGTFTLTPPIELGNSPDNVALDDFDGDGHVDAFALTHPLGGFPKLAVARGHGDGTFATSVKTPTAAGLLSARVADFDGDGLPDVVTGGYVFADDGPVETLFLHRNAGSGFFALATTVSLFDIPPTSSSPTTFALSSSLALADFDEDGTADVLLSSITSESATSGLTLLRGGGGFALAPPEFIDVNALPGGIFVSDGDHDGHLDVFLDMDNDFALLHGDGAGGFRLPAPLEQGAPQSDIAAADVNADRRPDLVVALQSGDVAVRVQLGAGDGTFRTAQEIDGLPPVQRLELGDVDGDGLVDLVAATAAPGASLAILRGGGDGTFGAATTIDAGAIRDLALADLDGDGWLDIVTARPEQFVGVLHNLGSGTFAPLATFNTAGDNLALAVGDLDEDGLLDVCVSHGAQDFISVLAGVGGGALGAATQIPIDFVNTRGFLLADLDLDGHLDLAGASNHFMPFEGGGGGHFSSVVWRMSGSGSGSFGAATVEQPWQVSGQLHAADVDRDGLPDLLLSPLHEPYFDSGRLTVVFGRTDGALADQFRYATGSQAGRTALADFDGNGFPDFAVTQGAEDAVSIHLNQSPAWASLGHAKLGPLGVPLLVGEGIAAPDQLVSVTASDLPRGATGLLVMGLTATFTPLPGGTLVPALDLALPIVAGKPLAERWPKGLPPGMPAYFQAWFAGAAAGLPAGQAATTNALVTLSQ